MDIKQLLEKMDQFAGQAVGQKPGDQWRGTDKAPPGKKLVGDSILKDLQKGKTPKNREQELSEEFEAFLQALEEENLGTHPKRPGRKSDRHARGHEPQPRYKTVKTDESMSDKDIELQDYRSMSDKEFQNAYKMTKTEWINKNQSLVVTNPSIRKGLGLDEAGNPAQQAAIAIAMKKAGKKPKNEGVAYKTTNPHPASRDPIVAKVVKQMRPGLKDLDMNNEAFLYFAYEIGKMRAREMWEDYGPAIKYFYQSGIGVNEGWESGPEEYEEPYDDADDAYDRQRQAKIDTEAEKEWAKLPKVSTYQCIGRGANMEPNQKFGPEFDTLEKALEYRAEIMKDPKTPHPEHIGINTLTRVKEQTNENSATTPQNKAHANQMMQDLSKMQTDVPNPDPELAATIVRRKDILMKQAKDLGIDESRAHKILNTWFKNRELADKFARGEVKIPTPQERRAELEKPKKQVKEYGADQPTGTAAPGQPQDKDIVTATNALKSATGSTAPAPMLDKALDTAAQGKPMDAQGAKALQQTMGMVAQAAKDPKLANQFKPFAQQAKQAISK